MGSHRITQETVEVLATGVGTARTTQQAVEVLHQSTGADRITQLAVEVLLSTVPKFRLDQLAIEILCNVPSGSTVDSAAANTLTLTSVATDTKTKVVDAANTLTLVQAVAHPTNVTSSNDLVLTQVATGEKYKSAAGANTLTLTQTLANSVTANRNIQQGLALLSTPTINIYRSRTVNQSLVLTQTATGVSLKAAKNTLVVTQVALALLVRTAKNLLEFTQLAESDTTFVRSTANLLPVSHQVGRLLTSRQSLTSTLTLTNTAVGKSSKPVYSSLTLTQVATGVQSKPAKNTLVLAGTATQSRSIGRSPSNQLFLTQSAKAVKVLSVNAANNLGMLQIAKGQRVKFGVASNTLVLSNDVVRTRYVLANSQLLSLSQTATYVKVSSRTATNNLALQQAVQLAKTMVRSAQNTLTFNQFYLKYTGFGVVAVPQAQGNKVEPITVLRSGELAIVLPQPEFGDVESNASRINIKRAMDGTKRVYKRTSPTSRLTYTFVIQRTKVLELRQFILAKNTATIQLSNWKGEQWIVQMTNNPFGLVETAFWQGDNKCTVTLEFEGVRIS